ncbi:MAG: aminoacyl-tRNA hydrolase [Candidatus Pacebacteria bacterium]|nr:aminoacyl-tRNA hydrolase [Candidatus Paceibacterota bacterium]
MYYIVGLGNPGEKYESTRHNVGWAALDYLIDKTGLPSLIDSSALSGRTTSGMLAGEEVSVLYPGTFMNNSGSAVTKLVPKNEVQKLIVVHDDIDLPLGEVKIGQGRGAGGNNGVKSIIDKLGSKEFVRVRVGIAPKSFWTGEMKRPAGGGPLERFVLKSFSGSEKKQLADIYERITIAIETVVSAGVESAMNKLN